MTSRVTGNKPDFRSEASWGEIRAYEGKPTPCDGRSNFRLLVNIKPSQCDTKLYVDCRPLTLSNGSSVPMSS